MKVNIKFKHRIMKVSSNEKSNNDSKDDKWNPWPIVIIGAMLNLLVFYIATQDVAVLFSSNLRTKLIQIKEEAGEDKILSCYYNTPQYNNDSTYPQLLPSDIYPHLCTHINIAFAKVVNKEIFLEDAQYTTLKEVVELKQKSPKLKVLLSVGGAGHNNGFSEMVVDHASRKIFIKSIKKILKEQNLDGIDLDWEFPAMHDEKQAVSRRERQHFSQLLREIKMEYIRENKDYILSVAVAAPQTIVDVSYDVDQINLYADLVNVMTYDFHYFTKFTPFTGFNSPLYSRSSEGMFMATLNINYTVHYFLSKGLDRNKIVVGIPTYGHTFTLVNPSNANVGAPASGFGKLGGLGFANYPDVCRFSEFNKKSVTIKYDEEAKVPYLYSDSGEWVSYESPRSVWLKAIYIKENLLRGAMIYSLNADDFQGRCRGIELGLGKTFPLASTVRLMLKYWK